MDSETAERLVSLAEEVDLDQLTLGMLEEKRIETLRNLSKGDYGHHDVLSALAHFGGVATEKEISGYLYTSPSVISKIVGPRNHKILKEESSEGYTVYTYRYSDRLMGLGGEATVSEFSEGSFSEAGAMSRMRNFDGRFGYVSHDFAGVEENDDGETVLYLPDRCRYWLRPGYEKVESEPEPEPEPESSGWLSFG
jgi:hypothetical protein